MPRDSLRFQVASPHVADRSIRMDVAAFVGFAAAGPLHTPVSIEDMVQFDNIFGKAYTLSWDRQSGAPLQAHLRSAVQLFFANGGRRCWVVRVAGEALSNLFLVPGMIHVGGGQAEPQAALLQARSEGAWSDALRVGSSLQRTDLGECRLQSHSPGRMQVDLPRSLQEQVQAGDLLLVTFRESGHLLYVAVDDTESLNQADGATPQTFSVLGRPFWLQPLTDLPLAGAPVTVRYRHPLDPPDLPPKPVGGYWLHYSFGEYELYLPASEAPPVGTLLAISLTGVGEIHLLVEGVRRATSEERRVWPGQFEEVVIITGSDPVRLLGQTAPGDLPTRGQVARLALDLWVEDEQGRMIHLRDLGLTGRHPRYVGYLPTDRTLFAEERPIQGDGDYPGQPLWPIIASPRFPLAAADQALQGCENDICLPLGMGVVEPYQFAQALQRQGSAPERDGLARFTPTLFVDPDLKSVRADGLEGELFQKRYVRGEPLLGIHSLWTLDEVTLMAVPDAVHPGWVASASERLVDAPVLTAQRDRSDGLHLTWNRLPLAQTYRVQIATDPEFTRDLRELILTATECAIAPPEGEARPHHFRVCGEQSGQRGPWSNTQSALLPYPLFSPREVREAPTLRVEVEGDGVYLFSWTMADADSCQLQMAGDPEFGDARIVYAGKRSPAALWHSGSSFACYRVRLRWGSAWGPWSNTVLIGPKRGRLRWETADDGDGGTPDPTLAADLKELHVAMLRIAMARGDLFALLSLPRTYVTSQIADYSRSLAVAMEVEEAGLSFGALYSPWLAVRGRDEHGSIQLSPPDGAMAGQYASRAFRPGVWVPAANQAIADAVDLGDATEDEQWARLERERVNLFTRGAAGVLAMGANTLSRSPEHGSVAVRRLFSLLRRLLLREGARVTFAPNDESFRQAAAAQVYRLLLELFRRGAFAGETPEQSFSVQVAPGLNTPEAIAAGRFVLDVQVAPSRPLAFMMVRLVHLAGGALQITEG